MNFFVELGAKRRIGLGPCFPSVFSPPAADERLCIYSTINVLINEELSRAFEEVVNFRHRSGCKQTS